MGCNNTSVKPRVLDIELAHYFWRQQLLRHLCRKARQASPPQRADAATALINDSQGRVAFHGIGDNSFQPLICFNRKASKPQRI